MGMALARSARWALVALAVLLLSVAFVRLRVARADGGSSARFELGAEQAQARSPAPLSEDGELGRSSGQPLPERAARVRDRRGGRALTNQGAAKPSAHAAGVAYLASPGALATCVDVLASSSVGAAPRALVPAGWRALYSIERIRTRGPPVG